MPQPTITRQSILRGAGTVKKDDVQMYSKDGIKLDLQLATFPVPVDGLGDMDTRRSDAMFKATFRPCGRITAGILGLLYPHTVPSIGSSLFGSADVPTYLHSMAGRKLTLPSTALTRMPNLKLSVKETAFANEAEITGLIANGSARTADGAMWAETAEAWTGSFDKDDIKGGSYIGTWNEVDFQTVAGWDIEFEMQIEPTVVDGIGTVDMMLSGVTVRAKCQPVGIDVASLLGYLNIQGATAALGTSIRSGEDLTIAADGALTVGLKDAGVVTGQVQFGEKMLRIGEVGWVAHRDFSGGTPGQLFTVALTA